MKVEVGQTYKLQIGVPVLIQEKRENPDGWRPGDPMEPEFYYIGSYQLAGHLPVNHVWLCEDGCDWTGNTESPYSLVGNTRPAKPLLFSK
jgi:hypothetical protein